MEIKCKCNTQKTGPKLNQYKLRKRGKDLRQKKKKNK